MIEPEILRKLLRYEPESGRLFWLERAQCDFLNPIATRRWNSRYSGREALTATDARGVRSGRVLGQRQVAHRVAWAIVHGEWPRETIDHINGDPGDNRILNLRAVSQAENQKNKAMSCRNTSGRVGVRYSDRCRHWRAEIKVDQKYKYLGCFKTFAEAAAARTAAEAAYGFHENHGRS